MAVADIPGYCAQRSLSGGRAHLAGLRPAEIRTHKSTRRLAERRAGCRAQPVARVPQSDLASISAWLATCVSFAIWVDPSLAPPSC